MKRIFIPFILVFSVLQLYAQNRQVDSLIDVLKKSKSNKEIIRACLSLSAQRSLRNFDENVNYARTGIAAALKQNDSIGLGVLYHNLGLAYYFKGNFDSAVAYYYSSVNILEKKQALPELASVYNDLGKFYRKNGSFKRAHDFYFRAMEIYRSLKDEAGIATIYNEDGVVYEMEDKLDEAAKNYSASLALRKKMHDQEGIAYSLNFLAGVFTQQKKFADAEQYNMDALKIREAMKDSFSISLSYSDMGDMYMAESKYDKAAESYTASNNYAIAIHYADLISNNYKQLSQAASLKGNYRQAYDYFQQHETLKDSIYRLETSRQVEELSSKYETAKKEEQIQNQQFEITKRNYWIAGISAIALLAVLLGLSFYRRIRMKQQAKLQLEIMKQQEIAAKAVIEAEENERKRIAGDLHDGVGQMMSAAKMNLSAIESRLLFSSEEQKKNFNKVVALIDESCAEVRSVSHNMMPNALLKSGLGSALREFIDKIDANILKINLDTLGLNGRIDSNIETVLYRIIQECVNNVIKHSGGSQLDISIMKDTDGISATIEDNGKGFDISDKSAFSGMGLKNIQSRIDYLKGTVEWDSSAANGTVVAIHVPVK